MADASSSNGSNNRSSGGSQNPVPRPAGKRFKQTGAPAGTGAQQQESQQQPRQQEGAHAVGAHAQRPAQGGQAGPVERPTPHVQLAGQRPAHRAHARTEAAEAPRMDPVYARRSRRPEPPRRSRMPIIAGVVAAVVVVGVLAFAGVKIYQTFFAQEEEVCTVEDGLEVYVTIESGATGDEIASALAEAHVVDDSSEYYSAVVSLGAETSLQPGVYLFYTHMDPLEVVKQLTLGSNVDGYTLTVSEGLTVESIAAVVEESLGISADEFIAQAVASNYVDDYAFLEDAANDSLEGFLFPKTYIFTDEPTADSVIRKMLDQYETEVSALDYETALAALEETYGVSFDEYDILIMASIIEREGLTTEQRYNVSSVFYNRLAADMYLQSDATMMYVTGGEVTSADLKTDSPYNTYLYEGLPPTPICAPSLESIEAALSPASTNYYYFYITTEAEYFSKTYEEHLAAIEAES